MTTRILSTLTLGCFALAGLFHVLSSATPGGGRPDVDVIARPAAVDLGEVEQGAELSFRFRVENTTARPIAIVDLEPSCGCTRLDPVRGRSIEAGEALTIAGLLETSGRRGVMSSHVVLTYRTPPSGVHRKAILSVGAFVRPTIRVEPEALSFDLPAGAAGPVVKTVAIDSAKLDGFTLRDPAASARWIAVEVEASQARRGSGPAILKVTLDPAALPADYWDSPAPAMSVEVRTTSEAEPRLVIPILIRKPGRRSAP